MAVYLAECFWTGVTEADLFDLDRRARRTGEASYLGRILVRQDEVVFCLFSASSEDHVLRACELAAIPFERVLEIDFGSGTLTRCQSRGLSAGGPS